MSSSGDKFVSADCALNATVQTGLQFIYFIKRAFKVGEMPRGVGGGGVWWGVLPDKRLMGMCRWMGSHFHDWIDYNGVAFSIELLEWGRTFSDFLG